MRKALVALAAMLSGTASFLIQPLAAQAVLAAGGGSTYTWVTVTAIFQVNLIAGYFIGGRLAERGGKSSALLFAGVAAGPLILLPGGGLAPPLQTVVQLTPAMISYVALSSIPIMLAARLGRSENAGKPYRIAAAASIGNAVGLTVGAASGEFIPISTAKLLLWALTSVSIALAVTLAWKWPPLADSSTAQGNAGTPDAGQESQAGEAERKSGTATAERSPRIPFLGSTAWNLPPPAAWALLAGLASATLAGFTTWVADRTLLAPFIWSAPLLVYLLVFSYVFAGLKIGRATGTVLGLALLAAAYLAPDKTDLELADIPALLFLLAVSLYGALSALEARKPANVDLARFWLTVAIGGAGGGILALALVHILDNPVEFVALAGIGILVTPSPRWRRRLLYLPAILGAAAAGWVLYSHYEAGTWEGLPGLTILAVGALLALVAATPLRLLGVPALGAAVIASLVWLTPFEGLQLVERGRSINGAWQVVAVPGSSKGILHQGILHGEQATEGPARNAAGAYYALHTGMGEALTLLKRTEAWDTLTARVIGLGAGASAAWSEEGQTWVFHELDPEVLEVAQRHFSYLSEARGTVDVVIGDGLRTLSEAPNDSVDVIVIDAYLGDSIPKHLITKEAFAVYAQKLKPQGVILTHTSNYFLNLDPIVNASAEAQGMTTLSRYNDTYPAEGTQPQSLASTWALSTANATILQGLRESGWKQAVGKTEWTEDLAPVLEVLYR